MMAMKIVSCMEEKEITSCLRSNATCVTSGTYNDAIPATVVKTKDCFYSSGELI